MRELSLFTGAGGGLLATHHLLGWQALGYVEWNSYCQQIISQRIKDGLLTEAPIFTDVREFVQSGAAEAYRGFIDVVSAGFPCQPFSVAGKQDAADDERNMWPATLEVIKSVQPRYAFLENVPGLLSAGTWDVDGATGAVEPPRGYFGRVLADLAEIGFNAEWGVLGASDVGGFHHRKRVWVVATDSKSQSVNDSGFKTTIHQEQSEQQLGNSYIQSATNSKHNGSFATAQPEKHGEDVSDHPQRTEITWQSAGICNAGYVADTSGSGCEELYTPTLAARAGYRARSNTTLDGRERTRFTVGEDIPEPVLCGVANDVADRVERTKSIGNGQYPAAAAIAWTVLSERLREVA